MMISEKNRGERLPAFAVLMIVATVLAVGYVVAAFAAGGTVYWSPYCGTGFFSVPVYALTMAAMLCRKRKNGFRACITVALALNIIGNYTQASWGIRYHGICGVLSLVGMIGMVFLIFYVYGKLRNVALHIVFLSLELLAEGITLAIVMAWDGGSLAYFVYAVSYVCYFLGMLFFLIRRNRDWKQERADRRHHELSLEQGLRTLKRMYEAGQISEQDYAYRKGELLNRL